jgi:hypothetical protein
MYYIDVLWYDPLVIKHGWEIHENSAGGGLFIAGKIISNHGWWIFHCEMRKDTGFRFRVGMGTLW